ncbi:RnfABCDGE type electron transport complex subunit B [Psychrobacter ciconiae]|uniref:RnfABCDGE type electron transport complex subunit B n=1 Tax=Psychrobacter ciconiae TaxID=1553449 RepID=UPI001D11EDB4|nr:RnfABCDGE type electron transport complex subunit B [Psychrobacter ciconiae]
MSQSVPKMLPFVELPLLFKPLALDKQPQTVQQKISAINDVLPQTQCGLCDHPDGCLPYAAAIVMDNEPYNKCVPGGQPVTDTIAKIIGKAHQALAAAKSNWETDALTGRPQEMRAIIREIDCIGCTKCIPACPVDAIVGTGKHMHTIFTDLCTGCELCIAPCPVDCIDLVPISRQISADTRQIEQRDLQSRYYHHLNRVADSLADSHHAKPVVSMMEAKLNNATAQSLDISADDAKITIAAAKLRTKIKKLEKQLSVRPNAQKQSELAALNAELAALV